MSKQEVILCESLETSLSRAIEQCPHFCVGAVHHVFSNFRAGDYQHGIVASGKRVQPAYGNADFRHERVPGAERLTGI